MEIVNACFLIDFYGQLLTEKNRSIMELHFAEDMSFSEIAEQMGVSRQAVHDSVKRGVKSLSQYEEKLGLVERFQEQKNVISRASKALEENDYELAKSLIYGLSEKL